VRLLLDTHVVLWQLGGTRTVGPQARDAIERADELTFSVVSFAEIGDLREHILGSGVGILGLASDHGLGVADLPVHHRDPFDRLLISQARSEGLTIVTADRHFTQYDVPTIDAVA